MPPVAEPFKVVEPPELMTLLPPALAATAWLARTVNDTLRVVLPAPLVVLANVTVSL